MIVDRYSGDVVLHQHVSWFLKKGFHPEFLVLESFLQKVSEGHCLNKSCVVCYGFVSVKRCSIVEVSQCASSQESPGQRAFCCPASYVLYCYAPGEPFPEK